MQKKKSFLVFCLLLAVYSLLSFITPVYADGCAISGPDTVSSGSYQYTVNNAQSGTKWCVTGSGASIDASGKVTVNSDACGSFTVTATTACGTASKDVRISNGTWVQTASSTCTAPSGSWNTDGGTYVDAGAYRYYYYCAACGSNNVLYSLIPYGKCPSDTVVWCGDPWSCAIISGCAACCAANITCPLWPSNVPRPSTCSAGGLETYYLRGTATYEWRCTGNTSPATVCAGGDNTLRLQSVSGNGQTGNICEQIQQPLTVSVTNGKNSSPQSGIGIGWQVQTQPTGASVTPTSGATDSNGLASTTLKLGSLPGDYTVNATCGQCTSGSPQTFTATAKCPDVPQYYQTDYPNDSYDNICKDYKNTSSSGYPGVKACGPGDETWKIKAKGCMLTNMAMLLGRYGSSFKPNALNSAMTSDINGYTPDGDVQLLLPDVVTGQQIKYVEKSAYKGDKKLGITVPKSLMDDYLKKCMPVIVQVYNSLTKSMHWVVVTGKSGDDYTINDPGYRANTKLSQYGDIYKIRPYENQNGGCQ